VGTEPVWTQGQRGEKIPARLESNETYIHSHQMHDLQNGCQVSSLQCHLQALKYSKQKHKHLPMYETCYGLSVFILLKHYIE
jgi:hypothetical protein